MSAVAVRRYRRNLRTECDNAVLYERLAELAGDEQMARAYQRIASIERSNAEFWRQRLLAVGAAGMMPRPGLRVRLLIWLAGRFGTGFVMPSVVRLNHADHAATPVDRVGYRDHFPELQAGPAPSRGRHRGDSGNTLRASVLGANDGLVSNASLVMGMAGAATPDHAILLAGVAGLVAGAFSMSLGEWLSVNSSREFYQAQITERAERLAVAPDDTRRYLESVYEDKGLDVQASSQVARQLLATPRMALDVLVREDLGVDPAELGGSAYAAAVSSFALFSCGALFPVLPYLFIGGTRALYASLICTFAGLSLIGVGTSLFTGRSLVFSIVRQFLITAAAVLATFVAGHLLGEAVRG
ncbi:VIT1/CCC1 transporter family protein [Frateuria aurantia]